MRRKTVAQTLVVFLLSAALLAAGLTALWRDWESKQRPPTPPPSQAAKPHWESDGSPNSASLGFTVFSTDASLLPLAEKNGLRPPDKGVMEFSRGGSFYILVSSFDADWTITIEKRS